MVIARGSTVGTGASGQAEETSTAVATSEEVCDVLVVEHSGVVRSEVVQMLRSAGISVAASADLPEALVLCRRMGFRALVIGWLVDRLFADEVAKMLRDQREDCSGAPAIVMSRLLEEETRMCLRPGTPIERIVQWPAEPRSFVACVKDLVRGGDHHALPESR